jgi:GAF domain-containing protein
MEFLRKLLIPPVFDSEEENSKARFLNGFSWITIALLLVAIVLISATGFVLYTIIVLIGLLAIFSLTLFLLRKRLLTLGGITVVTLAWIGITFQAFVTGGVRDVIIFGYLAIALIASLVLNIQAALLVVIASLGSIWTAALLEINGRLAPTLDIPFNYARDLSLIFIVTATLIYFATNSLRAALNQSRVLADELSARNQDLLTLRAELESRVEGRTSELTEMAARFEKRASQLQAVAEVAQAIISIQDINELLPNVATLISERFDYYHVGIFLIDERQENAVLRATNSEGGMRMLSRQHQLPIEPSSIVGYTAANRQPRIALDISQDTAFAVNPDLPETRSEMALPMVISNRLVGVLDVQSTDTDAFSQEDIRILGTLTDQVTIAIENANLFRETRTALAQAESVYQRYLGQSWQQYSERRYVAGFEFDGKKSRALEPDEVRNAADKAEGQGNVLAIPIIVGGKTIGTLNARPQSNDRLWTREERDLMQGIAERAALSLENARLLEESQRRAVKEQTISQASARIGASLDFGQILIATAKELEQALGSSEIIINLESKE